MANKFMQGTLIALAVFSVGCIQVEQQGAGTQGPSDRANRPLASEVDVVSQAQEKKEDGQYAQLREREDEARPRGNKDQDVKESVSELPVNEDALAERNVALPPSAQSPASAALPGRLALEKSKSHADARVIAQVLALAEPLDRETYAHFKDHRVKLVAEQPVSTFSIDVDTGSYSNVRRLLKAGQLPRHDAVRAEELINYFAYDYPVRADLAAPFALYKEIAPTPWNENTHLLHIGLKGYEVARDNLPPANLVFLIDVSGSMRSANKLELLKSSLKLLTQYLGSEDRVSIVVYAGASGVVLEPTPGNEKAQILAALERLSAGGSTNGGAGIQLAYAMAEQSFNPEGINRVLLATDGDFNVGTVNSQALKQLVEQKRNSGVALSTLGFGSGNYNDELMEQLADVGNGNYAYIDTLNEAQKVLVDEMGATMLTIAKDVKIQIEFNPAVVAEYRLIGYENRALNREDFSNDKVDAGEIGAGHTVTALYEVTLVGSEGRRIEPLRYQDGVAGGQHSDEIAFLRLRYKAPDAEVSQLLEWSIEREELIADLANTSNDFRFSAAAAGFAQTLRGGTYTEGFGFADIATLVQGARGEDRFGYRGEFLSLINLAQSLQTPNLSMVNDSDQPK